jgi:hypothetical protein
VRRSALNSCRGLIHGVALGGILTPASMSLAQAAERLHDFLRPLTGSGLTHTNRSPKFPVHFITLYSDAVVTRTRAER